jgi:hypothetical protein
MDKNDFNLSYKISDATPRNPALEIISADGFAMAIKEFINDGFGGIAHVSCDVYSGSSILCSTEYAAYFFKKLLAEIYGRVFLEMSIKTEDDRLVIIIEPGEKLPLCDSQMRDLIRIARNAGMKITLDGDNIRLSASFADAALRRVYAISARDGKSIMLYKLGEIFHCGAVYHVAKGRK